MQLKFAALLGLPSLLRAAAISASYSNNAIVEYEIRHRHIPASNGRSPSYRKRSSTLLSALDLNDHWIVSGGYFLDVEVGTPPQRLEVLLDTGSSDFFVPAAEAASCLRGQCPGGSFSRQLSSSLKTAQELGSFHIEYVDGSTANGSYAQDTVTIGDAKLMDHVFAIADEIQVSPFHENGPQYGILGLSFDGQETSICASGLRNCKTSFTTPTILDSLYDAGHIRSRSYSLFLDDVISKTGTILFGGIDTAKFTGDLVALAVQKDVDKGSWTHGMYVSQDVLLTSVSSTYNGTTAHLTPPAYVSTVILDSGAGGLNLPPFIYDRIMESAPVMLEHGGSCAMLCKHANLDAYLTIGLTGAAGQKTDVRIPYSNLLVPVQTGPYNNSAPFFYDGEELCVFAINRGTETDNALGDPLLRSAYTVFNLDEKTISLAQASRNSGVSNIRAIGRGPVPQVSVTGLADSA